MYRRLLILVIFLFALISSALAVPSEYYVKVNYKGDEVYYFDLSTGSQSTVAPVIQPHGAFGSPTFGPFATVSGSRYDNKSHYNDVSLVNENGQVVRQFSDAIPFSFYHHPLEKIFFFFTGYIRSDVVVATHLNYYEYENDKLVTVDVDDIAYLVLRTYMDYNQEDGYLYWAGDNGTVYKIDTKDMKNIQYGSEGFVFSERGRCSAKYNSNGVEIYQNGTLLMTVPEINLRCDDSPKLRLFWYEDDFLIIGVGGKCISVDVKKEAFTETISATGFDTYSKYQRSFYRVNLSKKGCILETLDASDCLK